MKNPVIVRIFDIVGGALCVSADDGQRVHDKIVPLLRDGTPVALSFEQVETLITTFLNAAIGQLYGEFPEDRIREMVSVRDMDEEDQALLKRVVDSAKKYFSNPKAFDEAWREEMGDDSE
jgi:hypothetical protein